MKLFERFVKEIKESSEQPMTKMISFLKTPIKVNVKGVDFDLIIKKGKMKDRLEAWLSNTHGKQVVSRNVVPDETLKDFLEKQAKIYKVKINLK
jgi:hypothetical protein